MMKLSTKLVLTCVGVAFGCKAPAEQIQRPLASVRSTEIRREQAAPLIREGQVAAAARFRLGFRTPGVLRQVHVREGDRVTKGQLLAQLEDVDVSAALRSAEADLDEAAHESMVSESLVAHGALARRQSERDGSQLLRAQARQRQALQMLDSTRLTAPVSGLVYARMAEPGEVTNPGRTVLVIDQDGEPCVRLGLPQRDLARVHRDQEVLVETTSDGPLQRFEAKVTSIVGAPNQEDALYTVEVKPKAAPWTGLRLGTHVKLTFNEKSPETVLRVPLDAIVRRRERDIVFVLEQTEGTTTARERRVSLGRAEGTAVALRDGVVEGERVVTEGAYFLEEGDGVRVAQ
jgi:membrane fusion protein, multidrug efflux system